MTEKKIDDVILFPVKSDGIGNVIVGENDHLLRRFGQLELITLTEKQPKLSLFRKRADEIFFVLSGEVQVSGEDMRSKSPSFGAGMAWTLKAQDSLGLLIPFGVKIDFTAQQESQILRLSTHEDGFDEEDSKEFI